MAKDRMGGARSDEWEWIGTGFDGMERDGTDEFGWDEVGWDGM